MSRTVALAVALVAPFAAACMSQQARSDRRWAADLTPAALEPTPTAGGAMGRLRVRVYADDAYRAQNPDHQAKIRLLVGRAAQLLEPTIGVSLEVADIRPWNRRSGDSEDLESVTDKLEVLDSGRDVDLVIGMVNALSRVSTDIHKLGMARLLGRHLVVRGLDDAAEVAAMESGLRTLRRDERQDLYSRRKRHKELVILLHEIGHVLGGMHVTGERDVLNPRYHWKVSALGQANAQVMRRAARARLAQGTAAAQREWKNTLTFVRSFPSAAWNEDEKAVLVALLERWAEGANQDEPGEALGEGMRPADRERFRAAERLYAAGRAADAWEDLEPLLDFYPDEPAVNRLACRVAALAQGDPSAIEKRCARAAQAAPSDAEPHLRLAQSYLAAGDKAKSLGAARKALDLLQRPSQPAGAAPRAAQADRTWGDLAALFQSLGAVTWAEQAARRAKDPKPVAEWAHTTRVRFGLAPGGPVSPEQEADYVAALTELLGDVYASRYAAAERRAAQLQRRFGGAAGIHTARCDMEIRRTRYAAARAHCRDALRRYPDSAWAHYLTGLLDKRDKKPAAAAEHLERAVALDPSLKHAYQVAAEIYDQLGRAKDKQRIADTYRARFGQALP